MEKTLQIIELTKATKGSRFANNFIDGLIVNWFPTVLLMLFNQMMAVLGNLEIQQKISEFSENNFLLNLFVGILISVAYFYLFELYNNGRTIGKYVTGTKAISTVGEKLQPGQVLKRTLIRLIPFEAFSFLGDNGWHDSWSNTRVVKISDYERALTMEFELNNLGKAETL